MKYTTLSLLVATFTALACFVVVPIIGLFMLSVVRPGSVTLSAGVPRLSDRPFPGEAKALVDAAIAAYGRLDILVNNSGVYEFGPLESVTELQFHKMFDVNVLGLLLVTQAAAPHLREGGSVINIGSGVTAITPPQTAVYTASKGAVDAITGVLANELGPRKIRVNTVSPSLTETEGTQSAGMLASEFEAGIVAQTPLGRLGQPQDIADVVAFVASDDARWVTGDKISAGGGLR